MVGDNAKILRVPRLLCDKQTSVFVAGRAHCYQTSVHNSCVCNELQALTKRHLVKRETDFDRKFFLKQSRSVLARLNISAERVPYAQVVAEYTGKKRKVYEKARLNVKGPRYEKQWSRIGMFVKADKLPVASLPEKAPRAIQHRSPEYNLLLASYLKPFEREFYELLDEFELRVIAKGMNNVQKAENLAQAATYFTDPVYVSADHSKFDSHNLMDHLRYCHKAYDKVFKSGYLRKLLEMQLRNRGWSKGGIKYRVNGTRMSGDYDTALGNCLVNHMLLSIVFRNVRHHLLLDGDDSVIVMSKQDLVKVDFSEFSKLGMTTTYDITEELNSVEFCRSRLIHNGAQWMFARDPYRALSNLFISLKNYGTDQTWLRWYAGLGWGELAQSNGVPILGPIANKLTKLHSKPIYPDDYEYKGRAGAYITPTDSARLQMYEAWGISPEEQIRMENEFVTPKGKPDAEDQEYFCTRPLQRAG